MDRLSNWTALQKSAFKKSLTAFDTTRNIRLNRKERWLLITVLLTNIAVSVLPSSHNINLIVRRLLLLKLKVKHGVKLEAKVDLRAKQKVLQQSQNLKGPWRSLINPLEPTFKQMRYFALKSMPSYTSRRLSKKNRLTFGGTGLFVFSFIRN